MNKLTTTDIAKPLGFKTHQVNLFWSIASIIKQNTKIDFDVYLPTKGMNLQRPFCWTLEQKQQLIYSIVKRAFIPKLAILIDKNSDEPVYQIIDGKQRLNAMLEFMRNEFPLSIAGREYYFTDCDDRLQMDIRSYSPYCEAAYFYDTEPISDDDKIAWFEQINFAGTPQDIEHLNKLKH